MENIWRYMMVNILLMMMVNLWLMGNSYPLVMTFTVRHGKIHHAINR